MTILTLMQTPKRAKKTLFVQRKKGHTRVPD